MHIQDQNTRISSVAMKTLPIDEKFTPLSAEHLDLLPVDDHSPFDILSYGLSREIAINGGMLKMGRSIGKGAFGTVFEAVFTHESSDEEHLVAVKINRLENRMQFNIETIKSMVIESNLLYEISRLNSNDEVPIARFFTACFVNPLRIICVQELYDTNLRSYIQSHRDVGISLQKIADFTYQLFQGLHFLESLSPPILHLDLKPENIFLEPNSCRIRIGDFGSSMRGAQRNDDKEIDYVVTRFYRPPEIVLGRPFDTSVDRWSLGCILFELHARTPLFPARNDFELLDMFFNFLGPIPSEIFFRRRIRWGEFVYADISRKQVRPKYHSGTVLSSLTRDRFHQHINVQVDGPYTPSVEEKEFTSYNYKTFRNLLMSLLKWNPKERLGTFEGIGHPFIINMMELYAEAKR